MEVGLDQALDKLALLNPAFITVKEIKELHPENFVERENPRPAGYSAMTRVHVGRLCIPTLTDSGATCNCITEAVSYTHLTLPTKA